MTYDDLLTGLRLNTNKSNLSDFDKEQLTYWLNQSLADIWAEPEWLIWPCLQTVSTVTLADYSTTMAGIADSDVWTVWSEDPRDLYSQGSAVGSVALAALRDGDNLRVQTDAVGDEVVIFHRAALPVYVWDGTNDDVVPDALVPWVLADVWVRYSEANLSAESEKMLAKAYSRREREMDKAMNVADATWRSAPWLNRNTWLEYASNNS